MLLPSLPRLLVVSLSCSFKSVWNALLVRWPSKRALGSVDSIEWKDLTRRRVRGMKKSSLLLIKRGFTPESFSSQYGTVDTREGKSTAEPCTYLENLSARISN